MGRSLSLAAYRVLSRRISRASLANAPRSRPIGELLWAHATSTDRLIALGELGLRLKSLRPDLNILITQELATMDQTASFPDVAQAEILDSDHPLSTRLFLEHWQPDICLWTGGGLMPNLISQAADKGIPMFLIDVDENDFPGHRHKWFPDLTRTSLDRFESILTTSGTAAAELRRIGVPDDKITVTGRLRGGASPVPFPEEDLSALARNLLGRPVWLAAHAHPSEFEPILTAHRTALRLVHRLLLVIIVADPDTLNNLGDLLAGSGLRYVYWSLGDEIDDNVQVLISDGTDDLGLWYRAAPLTFMASSLTVGQTGRDPLDAVALGSAVVFGPHVSDHRAVYSRLVSVGAGCTVGDGEGLGTAVIRLIAPDHAAAMALAGWEVATEGAQLTDTLIELIQDQLDLREAPNACP
ncbi:MAG: 3-deoxy-D-manno-octulosonic-acid transferase [Paracoccaceae bacterium]|jgi:3-deoxy-D-manno-octulosonic-acid transferase